MQRVITPVKAVIGLSSGLLLMQTVPAAPIVDTVGRLTLDGALVIAVGVLWRALAAKDAAKDTAVAAKDNAIAAKDAEVIAMAKAVTSSMVSVTEAVKEMRAGISELRDGIGELRDEVSRSSENAAMLRTIHTTLKGQRA